MSSNKSLTKSFKYKDVEIIAIDHDGQTGSMNLDGDEGSVRDRHWHFNPGDVVIDIGAAFGSYTLTALSQGAKVTAFEPVLFRDLVNNIKINNWKCNVINKGLWSEDGFIKTLVGISELPTFIKEKADPCWPVITLDSSVVMLEDKIDMIKIDVEAAELEVLKGGVECIKKYKPQFLIENHDFMDSELAGKVKEFLEKLGYKEECKTPYNSVSHSFFKYEK